MGRWRRPLRRLRSPPAAQATAGGGGGEPPATQAAAGGGGGEPPATQATAGGGGGEPPDKPPEPAEEPEPDEDDGMLRMSFLDHLEELRTSIIRAIAGVGSPSLSASFLPTNFG